MRNRFSALLIIFLGWLQAGFSQSPEAPEAPVIVTDPIVAISSYFNASLPEDEWTELIVTADNVDMRNWTLRDDNASQTSPQTPITFNNIALWNNLRQGTIIMIWHRTLSSAGTPHPQDPDKSDGYIEVAAQNPAYFTGGSFPNNTLNIASGGDLLQLRNGANTFIHALGHIQTLPVAGTWVTLPANPKLNYAGAINALDAVFVCPGDSLALYGWTVPLNGTTWANKGTTITQGLPNTCSASSTANALYWRSLRQPKWANPTLTGTVNAANTAVTLNWSPAATDANPTDGLQGYIIIRNTVNTFGNPVDGHTYYAGENVTGGGVVVANVVNSQTLTYTDNTPVSCTNGVYYRVHAYRYISDNIHGNDYDLSRGRAYNETSFANAYVIVPAPVPPTSASSDRDNFCEDDAGNITLSATGGSGTTLNWYQDACGGTLLGPGAGANNSITIPSPTATTTYYARWENSCGNSTCASVTVTVLPNVPASVSITVDNNTVCEGISVTFTATPVNGGTTPSYQWVVNGGNVGTNSNIFSYIPADGDVVMVILTSNAQCVTGSPANSNQITITVIQNLPVAASITALPGTTVCAGTTVTYMASVNNGGNFPTFQWYLNGNPVGTNSSVYSNVPVDGDQVYCIVTSDLTCTTGNPATSNTITITVSAGLPVSVSITADPGNVICAGITVTYTATPVNGGSNPAYQWYLNGNPVGTNSPTYSNVPVDGDAIYCIVTSSESCATGNPATSNTITITITSLMPVSVSIAAAPGTLVCPGTTVTYTATPTNGGTTPVYQWFLNGNPVGSDNPVYSHIPADGDVITCQLTSDLSCATGNPATSNQVTISLLPGMPVSVSITASPGNVVCSGTTVTYTATPVNGGITPVYQWYLNGSPVGSNTPTFSHNPANGDAVYCILTSNETCATGSPATSNTVNITISATVPLSVSLSANPGNVVCANTNVTYNATAINGGATPTYQWYLNGNPVGSNSPSYSNQPVDGDQIYCVVTSSLSCATGSPANSNTITMTITAPVAVSITIDANPGTTICSGTSVIYTATSMNGGTAPQYQWLVNGTAVGTNDSVFSNTPADGDVITCTLISNAGCVTNNPATSNSLTIIFTTAMSASVTVSTDHPSVCPGTHVTMTATPTYSGSAPNYEWLVDGIVAQQGNSTVFSTTSLTGGEVVICRMTSSLSCLVANPVQSSPLTIAAEPPPVVKLSDKDYLCVGKPEVLDAGPGFAAYLWQDGSTDRYYSASVENLYWVKVTDSLGCLGSDSISMEICPGEFYIPSAFSPNGDGLNDIFKVVTDQENITDFSMMIFDRWGAAIFETHDIKSGWDGKINTDAALEGTYVWKVSYRLGTDGKPNVLHGTVTVVL